MRIQIHRGTDEIGGNCIEVTSKTDRLLIDFGWPLGSLDNPNFQNQFKGKKTKALIESGFLPNIEGLYPHDTLGFKAALLSHSHPDHYGFLSHVNPELPIYSHHITGRIIFAATLFSQAESIKARIKAVTPGRPFPIGELVVKPFEADHSAAGAYSFLILDKNTGIRIFYSGDIAGHLRNRNMFDKLLKRKWNLDCLLLEGTNIDRGKGNYPNEEAVKAGIETVFREHKGYVFFACSSQNLSRLQSTYEAACATGRELVIDPYTAFILQMYEPLRKNSLRFDSEGIRIFFTQSTHTSVLDKKFRNLVIKMRRTGISRNEILANPARYVLKDSWNMRNSFAPAAKYMSEKPVVIYSLWEGYLKRDLDFWDKNGIEILRIHTSGHAYREELLQLVRAMKPKIIVPIHTDHKELFQEVFKGFSVVSLGKSEKYNLSTSQ